MHNSIIKPWGYSGFARRIFLGERLLIECISKAFMCQILAYMIYNSPKFVFLLFNSCPKSIICAWTLKADSMARFFLFNTEHFVLYQLWVLLFSMLTMVKHCHIIRKYSAFLKLKALQNTQFLCLATVFQKISQITLGDFFFQFFLIHFFYNLSIKFTTENLKQFFSFPLFVKERYALQLM